VWHIAFRRPLARAGALHRQVQLLLQLQETQSSGVKPLLQMKMSGMSPCDMLLVVTAMRVGTQTAQVAWGISALAQQQHAGALASPRSSWHGRCLRWS
jgi:hypothetical protein